MNKVGDRKVIYSGSFVVSLGESISFNLKVEETDIPVTVFIEENERDDKAPATWETKEGKLAITFYGFTKRSGVRIIQQPVKIGNFAEQDLTFSSAIERHINAFLVHFQVMLGGENNE